MLGAFSKINQGFKAIYIINSSCIRQDQEIILKLHIKVFGHIEKNYKFILKLYINASSYIKKRHEIILEICINTSSFL